MALYDPNEFPEAEAQDFTLADVLAWARTKPAGEEYCYTDPFNCAMCRFLRETGRAQVPWVVWDRWGDDAAGGASHTFDRGVFDAISKRCETRSNGSGMWTFGGLADRLEKALAR